MTQGCGAPAGGVALAGVDVGSQAVVQGTVVRGGAPVTNAYVRLLNADGDFVAEVPTSEEGRFRFFAAPGSWTVRVLAPGGVKADQAVEADTGKAVEVQVAL